MKSALSSRKTGFTLIELMVVVAIIGLVLSMALPSMTAARKTANESSAIATLKAVNAGTLEYWNRFHSLPATLRILNRAGCIDSLLAGGLKSGYRFRYRRTGDRWSLTATPELSRTTGDRSFFVDQSGVIRFSPRANATAASPPLD